MNREILCSIVILTYNNLIYTKLCLDSLFENTPPRIPYEIILVDNASTDGTVEFLESLKIENLVKICNKENKGFSAGCNQGAKKAKGKYLVFLNNDTIPQEKWLEEMIWAIENHFKIGIVGSLLLYPNRTIQHGGMVFEALPSIPHLYRGYREDFVLARTPKTLQAVTGACLLIPRSLFFEVDGFDEFYVNGYEDTDLCCKVRQKGYRVLYWPNSTLIHFEAVSDDRFEKEFVNSALFKEQWQSFVAIDSPGHFWNEDPERALNYIASSFASLAMIPFLP